MERRAVPQPLESTSDVRSAHHRYDAIVIGAGIAGLAFTLRLPPEWKVALLTKGVLGESNTRYAQGGLAAAVGADDSPALHEEDTLVAGAGLSDPEAVRRLVDGAPAAVAWLTQLGANFDTDADGVPLLGREAAHSRRRVLHAGGDATGAEIERALVARVREDAGADLFEGAFALDLIVVANRCRGIIAELAPGTGLVTLEAPLTVIAAGGAGALWAVSSNPPGATADGLAMALRAGVPIADVEFMQFHPTVLTGEIPFLISEAVRGEGAYLRGAKNARFMLDLHPLAELAPRDVVARGIQRQMANDGVGHVNLDLRHLDAETTRVRFPTIARELASRDLDLATDLIPVAPAAHYFMGGIIAGPTGQTGLPGLLALGEAACTGIHGANRLASNSLLEGLVFGVAAADAVAGTAAPGFHLSTIENPHRANATSTDAIARMGAAEVAHLRQRLQRTMSRHVAVLRDAGGLEDAANEIAAIANRIGEPSPRERGQPASGDETADVRADSELRNMVRAAAAIVVAAKLREESRGAHFRTDYPARDPDLDGQHLIAAHGSWRYGRLDAALAAGTESSVAPAGSGGFSQPGR
ncbi:MAG: L-aspartate oxidase [Chloroflexia bacterium]|nr:L-aspartate oxidase [Chloroflexia bacterium]